MRASLSALGMATYNAVFDFLEHCVLLVKDAIQFSFKIFPTTFLNDRACRLSVTEKLELEFDGDRRGEWGLVSVVKGTRGETRDGVLSTDLPFIAEV